MKKLNIFSIFLLMLRPFLTGCSKDEIIFDSELPRFELRPGYQLLEVIVPQGTLTTDKIYIIGEFNGGMDAVGDPRWQLEKASDTDVKWGVYLNPADFIDGKTLADGYKSAEILGGFLPGEREDFRRANGWGFPGTSQKPAKRDLVITVEGFGKFIKAIKINPGIRRSGFGAV